MLLRLSRRVARPKSSATVSSQKKCLQQPKNMQRFMSTMSVMGVEGKKRMICRQGKNVQRFVSTSSIKKDMMCQQGKNMQRFVSTTSVMSQQHKNMQRFMSTTSAVSSAEGKKEKKEERSYGGYVFAGYVFSQELTRSYRFNERSNHTGFSR